MANMQAAKAAKLVKEAVKDASFMDARRETDTIRLWENYKDQALLWRSLALLQIPTTLFAIVFSMILWHTRHIKLDVPREPLPGIYSAQEIPDEKFVEVATDLINLIASYTPATARPQFKKAKEFLKEPLLGKFEAEMMQTELKAIENTSRTQIFFADPSKILTARISNSEVQVQIDGTRLKLVGGKELPPAPTRYLVTLTTVPRNMLNPYGIVVSNVQFAAIKHKE
jgi:hypothetical protein